MENEHIWVNINVHFIATVVLFVRSEIQPEIWLVDTNIASFKLRSVVGIFQTSFVAISHHITDCGDCYLVDELAPDPG